MKKTFLSALVLATVFLAVSQVQAEESFRLELRENIKTVVEDGKEASMTPSEIRKEVRETVRQELQEKKQNLFDRVKDFVKKKIRFDARITGEITSVGANALTVKGDDGKDYTLNISSETKLVRRFGGKSETAEFSVGNKVNAFGKFANEEKTVINAKLVRNISIQKKWGVFFGKVTSKGDTSFVIESSNRGTQTVFIEGAKLENRKEEDIVYADIQVDHRVRVKGMWDRSSNEITEVDEIKDFSIPAQPVKD